jgi:protein-S-isoprenylcysteine O-methyltransferase Ste14
LRDPADPGGAPGYAHSRRWDLIAALPLILFNGLAAIGFAITAAKSLQKPLDLAGGLQIVSEAGSFVFFLMEAIVVCIRRLPLRKLHALLPRASALLAAYAPFTLLLLPHRALPPPQSIASILLLLAGTFGGIVSLSYLGRSFAILPQARRLVTNGPYHYVRHPIYLFGQLSLIGVGLQFAQPWGLMIAVAGCLLQFPRMAFEEQVLTAAFPDYAAYRTKTAMLVPGLF